MIDVPAEALCMSCLTVVPDTEIILVVVDEDVTEDHCISCAADIVACPEMLLRAHYEAKARRERKCP